MALCQACLLGSGRWSFALASLDKPIINHKKCVSLAKMLPSSKTYRANSSEVRIDQFMVCGLGNLGQHCVAVLKEYGVSVSAIDKVQPGWEISNLPNLLEEFLIGGCHQPSVLEQARILRSTWNFQADNSHLLVVTSIQPGVDGGRHCFRGCVVCAARKH